MTVHEFRRSSKLMAFLEKTQTFSSITPIACDDCFQLRTTFLQDDLKCPKHSGSSECEDERTQATLSSSSYLSSASERSHCEDVLRTENTQLKTQLANIMAIVEKSRLNEQNSAKASRAEMERIQAEKNRLSEENRVLKIKLEAKVINDEMAQIDFNGTRDSAAVSSSISTPLSITIDAELDDKAEESSLEIMKDENIKLTVDAMQTHPRSSRVQKEACRALQTLSFQEKGLFSILANNQDKIRRVGAIHVIIDAMKMHLDVAEVQVEAFAALSHLSCGNERNKNMISEIGGIDAIVSGMNRHLDSACVQEQGSFVLYTLSTNKNKNLQAMRDAKIRRVGGIQAICNGRARHPTIDSLQCCAVAALSRIM